MQKHLSILFFYSLIFAFIVSSCQSHPTISGSIRGLGDDFILLNYYEIDNPDAEEGTDTIWAKNDRFRYDNQFAGNFKVILTPAPLIYKREDGGIFISEAIYASLLLQKGEKVKIKGEIEPGYLSYKVSGKGRNADLARQREKYKKYSIESDSIEMVLDYYFNLERSDENDSIINDLFVKRSEKFDARREIKKEYALTHPEKILSVEYFVGSLTLETVDEYHHLISETAQNSVYAAAYRDLLSELEQYKNYLANTEVISLGGAAPEFTLSSIDGRRVSLSDFENEYLVLDFWGSWCGPCISGFPEMKKYYEKYGGTIEFIGIACNDKEDAWKSAVSEHRLEWTQLIDDPEDKTSVKYAVGGYPTKIILDKNRNIVDIYLGEGNDFYEHLDTLMSGRD